MEIHDGHFYTPGGKRFRVWGVNLTGGACYPEKADAPKVARLLASMGINGVRFHFLDSDWGEERSIFRYDTATTRVFNPDHLDRLDYFVAELKKQGICSNFNLNVGRNYREKDGVPFYEYLGMAKAVTLFNHRIIALQKEYANMLLTHRNPYTGKEYRNEPALAFLEIVNENSLVEAWFTGRLRGTHTSTRTSTWIDIPPYYAAELTLKYNAWLDRKLSNDQLEALRKEAGVDAGTLIPRLDPDEFDEASEFRFHTEARFIMETENEFYWGMYRYLKDSVKVNQLVAANSDHNHYKSGYALLSSTSRLDYVDGHVYWQHPSYGTDPETGERTFAIDNTPMVNDPLWSTPVQLSRSAVRGKPYTVSETNHPYPNEYACEGYPVLGAYALLQDWDGIYFYTFEHDDPSRWKKKNPGHFDILNDPVKMANLRAGALMFHRGDVEPANTIVLRHYDEPGIIEAIREDPAPGPYYTPGFPGVIPLISKTRIASFSGGENHFPELTEKKIIESETGELAWHVDGGKGAVMVNTPGTQALTGFSQITGNLATENLQAMPLNDFATVVLTSLDGRPIDSSDKLLLTITARSILSRAGWNKERTTLTEWGETPYKIEQVTGKVSLTGLTSRKQVTVYPLDGTGNPAGDPVPAVKKNGAWVFEPGLFPAVAYLVELK